MLLRRHVREAKKTCVRSHREQNVRSQSIAPPPASGSACFSGGGERCCLYFPRLLCGCGPSRTQRTDYFVFPTQSSRSAAVALLHPGRSSSRALEPPAFFLFFSPHFGFPKENSRLLITQKVCCFDRQVSNARQTLSGCIVQLRVAYRVQANNFGRSKHDKWRCHELCAAFASWWMLASCAGRGATGSSRIRCSLFLLQLHGLHNHRGRQTKSRGCWRAALHRLLAEESKR